MCLSFDTSPQYTALGVGRDAMAKKPVNIVRYFSRPTGSHLWNMAIFLSVNSLKL